MNFIKIPKPTNACESNDLSLCWKNSGLHSLDVELFNADHVKNIVYNVIQDACNRTDVGCFSWTIRKKKIIY